MVVVVVVVVGAEQDEGEAEPKLLGTLQKEIEQNKGNNSLMSSITHPSSEKTSSPDLSIEIMDVLEHSITTAKKPIE